MVVTDRDVASRSEIAEPDRARATADDAVASTPRGFVGQGQIPPVAREVSPRPQGPTASEQAYGDDLSVEAKQHIKHCIDKLNEYRAAGKPPRPPLQEYRPLTMFAIAGSHDRDADGRAHAHIAKSFENNGAGPPRPRGVNATTENQGFVSGTDVNACVDKILAAMMAEGPSRTGVPNHHDNIMDPAAKLVGVGIVVGDLEGVPGVWLTTDFVGTG